MNNQDVTASLSLPETPKRKNKAKPHRTITPEHLDAAIEAVKARGEKSFGALRAELRKKGYSDRDMRLQGLDAPIVGRKVS